MVRIVDYSGEETWLRPSDVRKVVTRMDKRWRSGAPVGDEVRFYVFHLDREVLVASAEGDCDELLEHLGIKSRPNY